jgi:hypothetical protein
MENEELPRPYGGRNDRCYLFNLTTKDNQSNIPKTSENQTQPYNGSDRGIPNLGNGKPSLESSL